MKFEFDSNNVTELRAVEAAVAVLLGKHATKSLGDITVNIDGKMTADALVAAVAQAQEKLEAAQAIPSPERAEAPRVQDQILGKPWVETPVGVMNTETGDLVRPAADAESVQLDSAGQPWNPELHSSSRSKVADGTWKKKRGLKAPEQVIADAFDAMVTAAAPTPPAVPVPPAPVTPPAPPVPAAPSAEQKIWALVTAQVVTINRVLEVAQAHGFADLGALRQADEAKKLEVLRVLEGE